MDMVVSGKLKFVIGEHIELLEPGDCIYFDAKNPHGMVAIDGQDCRFLAVLI
jgi:mannose-6-phosphate isomerase-like protein (cupin superfamily)